MFWNVENYFDSYDDPLTNDDEFTPYGEKHWTWNRFNEKRVAMAKTIIAASEAFDSPPVIIGLAEVENRLVTKYLAEKPPLSYYSEYGFIHKESGDPRGIDVALLYRKDSFIVLDSDSLRVNSFSTRDILYVKGVTVPGNDTIHLFVNHWPSKLGGKVKTDIKRDIVSQLLSLTIDSLEISNPGQPIVVMGDFNDDIDSICPGIVHIRPSVPVVNDNSVKKQKIFSGTLKYHGGWETIDHFFISSDIRNKSRALIFAPEFLLEEDKTYLGMKPRRTYIGPRYNGGCSDHLPIILQIDDVF